MKHLLSILVIATFFLPFTATAESSATCGGQIFSEKVYSDSDVNAAADRCIAAGGKTGTGATGTDSKGDYGTVTCTNTSACSAPADTPKTVPQITVTKSPTTGASTNSVSGNGNLKYIPLEPLPGVARAQDGTASFSDLLAGIFRLIIILGSMFAVVMLVVSGITIMLSTTPVKISGAKERAMAALIGLGLLAVSWLILFTINPNLLKFNLLVPNSSVQTNPSQKSTQTAPKNAASYNDELSKCPAGKLTSDSDGTIYCKP